MLISYPGICLKLRLLISKPLCPCISMHILHIVLNKFPMVMTRRICVTIKSSSGVIISCILITLMFDSIVML